MGLQQGVASPLRGTLETHAALAVLRRWWYARSRWICCFTTTTSLQANQSPPNLQSHTPHQNPDTHRSRQLNSPVNTPLTQVHLRLSSIALGTTATTMMALTAAIAPMASAV